MFLNQHKLLLSEVKNKIEFDTIMSTSTMREDKEAHSGSDATSFFCFFFIKFFVRIIAGVLGVLIGILLLIAASWADSGYVAMLALDQGPWPRIEIEDFSSHEFSAQFTIIMCRVCGALMFIISLYFLITANVLYHLLFDDKPWNTATWSQIRKQADMILVRSGVRDETTSDQFNRMTEEQQEDMNQYTVTRFNSKRP